VLIVASCEHRTAVNTTAKYHHNQLGTLSVPASSNYVPLSVQAAHTLSCQCQLSATSLVPFDSANRLSVIDGHGWNVCSAGPTFYPTMLTSTSLSAEQVHQFVNCAGQAQQFPSVAAAVALVDMLRTSSVESSVLLTPANGLLTTPGAAMQTLMMPATEPPLRQPASLDNHLTAGTATQQLLTVEQPLQCSLPAIGPCGQIIAEGLPVGVLPCSSINSLLTFPTQYLASEQWPVIGCECCLHRTDSPMTGVSVCN